MKTETKQTRSRKRDNSPHWDNWHVRLPNHDDQQKAIALFHRSGAKTKSDFVRARLLDESFKVITVDKTTVEYYRKLSNISALIHKIGVLYNQAVCRRLSISKRTLQTLRDTGKISFSMVGHKCYYKESDITEVLKAQTK